MPYTVHDTPEVEDRIERDLDEIVTTVRQSDPALRALLLTGGFARGEGAVLDGEPQNDYDLVAVRGLGAPVGYGRLAERLEDRLGIHVDLAPISALRLRWVSGSIFWYETARRGRVLWGEDLLHRIPVTSVEDVEPDEGARLLVNRAAGILLARGEPAHERRIQAAKGILAALDAHLLAQGEFPPSQRERWDRYQVLRHAGRAPVALQQLGRWLPWAYRFKVNPEAADRPEAETACHAAADAILKALPVALEHAGLSSLAEYGRQDGLADHLYYMANAGRVPGAPRLRWNPSGRVRRATVRLLEAFRDGTLDRREARAQLDDLADPGPAPLETLRTLRGATLQ